MASYLGRNVNLTLLLIIIGVVVVLVGTTVFFQRSLQTRTSNLEDTYDNLQSCDAALENYQGKYADAAAQVNETVQDIRKYDQLYERKVGELSDTQKNLLSTKTQLEFEKLQKEKFQENYEDAVAEQQDLELQIISKNVLIADLRDQIDDLDYELANCGSS